MFHFHKKNLIQKSGPRRPVTRTYNRLSALSTQMATHVKIDLINGITVFKKRINIGKIIDLIENGEFARLYNVLPLHDLPKDLTGLHKTLSEGARKTSLISMQAMPPNANEHLRFDVTNPRVQAYINNVAGGMIKYIDESTRKNVKNIITDYMKIAKPPNKVAQQIKQCVGILPQHRIALEKYRAGLEAEKLPETQIEKLSSKYEDKLLNYRARMIARTESRRLINQGQKEVWQEGVRQGYISGGTKVWVVDGAPCDLCEPMDGEETDLDGTWTLSDGTVCEIPTDSHPNCMCGQEIIFKT